MSKNSTASYKVMKAAISPNRIPVKLAGLDEESQGTAQESTPVPYAAGENISAARWISQIYNQYAVVAPQEARGKK